MVGENKNPLFEKYRGVEGAIKDICGSGVKTKILISLKREPIRLYKISDLIDCKRTNTIPELKELQEMHLIEKDEMENNIETGLGVNESLMSIGLYKPGNAYEFSSCFTSSEDDAVEFANELFKHYKKISNEVKKDEL